jgi:hypothetical protein
LIYTRPVAVDDYKAREEERSQKTTAENNARATMLAMILDRLPEPSALFEIAVKALWSQINGGNQKEIAKAIGRPITKKNPWSWDDLRGDRFLEVAVRILTISELHTSGYGDITLCPRLTALAQACQIDIDAVRSAAQWDGLTQTKMTVLSDSASPGAS